MWRGIILKQRAFIFIFYILQVCSRLLTRCLIVTGNQPFSRAHQVCSSWWPNVHLSRGLCQAVSGRRGAPGERRRAPHAAAQGFALERSGRHDARVCRHAVRRDRGGAARGHRGVRVGGAEDGYGCRAPATR